MTTASKIREALNTAKLYKAKKEAAGDDISNFHLTTRNQRL